MSLDTPHSRDRLARILEWAKREPEPFDHLALVGRFGLKEAHARVILARLVKSGQVQRVGRGLYRRLESELAAAGRDS